MGPRPPDFAEHEEFVRKSPTFQKWMNLQRGQKLRYACRDFVKDQGDDEERLMRRIMIARRNNLRDHDVLKRARRKQALLEQQHLKQPPSQQQQQQQQQQGAVKEKEKGIKGGGESAESGDAEMTKTNAEDAKHGEEGNRQDQKVASLLVEELPIVRRRRTPALFTDKDVSKEMDVPAVEATRSYRAWSELPDGAEFVYNQKYIKGMPNHDWLLRKNIWRRMRYRRENKKMVEELLQETGGDATSRTKRAASSGAVRVSRRRRPTNDPLEGVDTGTNAGVSTASRIVDEALLSQTTGVLPGMDPTGVSNVPYNPLGQHSGGRHNHDTESGIAVAASIQHHLGETSATTTDGAIGGVPGGGPHDADSAAVAAAVAAAESYVRSPYVHNPLEVSTNVVAAANAAGLGLALDAAARLAAAAAANSIGTGVVNEEDEEAAVLAASAVTGQPSSTDRVEPPSLPQPPMDGTQPSVDV